MSIIDPEGFFNGDRLRRCSNAAQLHWPRLFLASNGFARFEINYAKIIGRAYPTFHPAPSETELWAWLKEYATNHLLFLFEYDGQLWGQWDTKSELLPRYKTASDRRSPFPPEPAFTEWKSAYRIEKNGFPKHFRKVAEIFLHGVGVGVGVGGGDGVGEDTQNLRVFPKQDPIQSKASDLDAPTSERFEEFWQKYPRKQRKDFACSQFVGLVTVNTEAAVFSCLDRYLASDEVARGIVMNPDKWLYEQHRNGWDGDWPRRQSKDLSDKMLDTMTRNLRNYGRLT